MRTEITSPVVEHLTDPNDLILNIAQMRDASHVQKFRIPSTPLEEERIIQESVARAINQRKSAEIRTAGAGGGRGRGGRGRGGRGQVRGSSNPLSADMVAGEGSSRQSRGGG